jgi:hypothetical protein
MVAIITAIGIIVQAAAAVALFLVTRQLVFVTKQLVRATNRLVLGESAPEITITVPTEPISAESAKLVFANVGGCAAINVESKGIGIAVFRNSFGEEVKKTKELKRWKRKQIRRGGRITGNCWERAKRTLDLPSDLQYDDKLKFERSILRIGVSCRSSIRHKLYSFTRDYEPKILPSRDILLVPLG